MRHILRYSLAAIVGAALAFSSVSAVHAKTPTQVLKPYKAYRAALKAGDNEKASKKAYDAWRAAEKALGDSKMTGDLAFNFADIPSDGPSKRSKLYKQRVQAFERSIELARFHEEAPDEIEIDRRLKLAAHGITLYKLKNGKAAPKTNLKYFKAAKAAIDGYGKTGTTYDGEYEALLTRYYERRSDYNKALFHAEKARVIFETRKDDLFSPYSHAVKLFKADALIGKNEKIAGALEYQDVMQNLEGTLDADHPFVNQAFVGWMRTRADIEDAGKLSEAEAAGLCECWPYENYKEKAVPLVRVPPVMPRSATRSGYVDVVFDVDGNGTPINIKSIYATEPKFIDPTLKSVGKWRYSKLDAGVNPASRKGVAAKVTFRLTDEGGRLIPARGL